MEVKVPYGKDFLSFEVEGERVMGVLSPLEVPPSPNPASEVEEALRGPIEAPPLPHLPLKGRRVAIAVDDVTRVTPTHQVLPPLLEALGEGGVRREDVEIIVALGTHRPMTREEMELKYGVEVVEEYRVVNHAFDDEASLTRLGVVEGDVPVWINRDFVEADLRIATGNLIPHFNAGWGAGAKILLPGLAGEETVGRMHVHSALTTPNGLGMDENPTRRLIDAFAGKVGIHLLVNTAVTRRREVVKVFAGHYVTAHRRGVEFAKRIYGIPAPGDADLTVSSSHPADIDYWQGQKGLFSADLATKPGGGIIEVTPCPEGVSAAHPAWINYLQHGTRELKEMYEGGEVEDLVALGLALNVVHVREKHPIGIISNGISHRDAGRMGFEKYATVEEALETFTSRLGGDLKVNILTHGGESYPTPGGLKRRKGKKIP